MKTSVMFAIMPMIWAAALVAQAPKEPSDGFKLEPARERVDVLVIDHAERPETD